MKTWLICGKNVFSKKEKSHEILFNNANIDDFVPAFTFEGIQFYRKIK